MSDRSFAERLEQAHELLNRSLPPSDAIPINLEAVLLRHGLGLPLVETSGSRHGALRLVNGVWHPVVYRSPSDINRSRLLPRERFTVAHELAHALVEDGLQLRPLRDAHYWALEDLCDDFAAAVLIPEIEVVRHVEGITGAQRLLHQIDKLASATESSLVVAARRILGKLPGGSAWGVREVTKAELRRTVLRWSGPLASHGMDCGPSHT